MKLKLGLVPMFFFPARGAFQFTGTPSPPKKELLGELLEVTSGAVVQTFPLLVFFPKIFGAHF